jgi:protein SCO1/2
MILAAGMTAIARGEATPSEIVASVRFDQKTGSRVPGDAIFTDSTGKSVRFDDLPDGRPVLLTLAYFDCPMLCKMVLDGTVQSLQDLTLAPGRDYTWVVISIDPTDTPDKARQRKATLEPRDIHGGTGTGWRFLTGDEAAIKQVAEAVGFRYRYDQASGQYAHPAGVIALTGDGRVSRYFFGTRYDRDDLRLGLVESSNGSVGSITDQVLLRCYHYDPQTGQYGLAIMNLVRAGGAATAIGLGVMIVGLNRRMKRRAKEGAAA